MKGLLEVMWGYDIDWIIEQIRSTGLGIGKIIGRGI